jgi:hypothetical protein
MACSVLAESLVRQVEQDVTSLGISAASTYSPQTINATISKLREVVEGALLRHGERHAGLLEQYKGSVALQVSKAYFPLLCMLPHSFAGGSLPSESFALPARAAPFASTPPRRSILAELSSLGAETGADAGHPEGD